MDIRIRKIELVELEKLKRMMQLYLHDLSVNFPIDFNSEKCEYEYDLSSYFDKNSAYFIECENEISGFVLVDINPDNNFELSEMFVLNNYKGKNVGAETVKLILDLYKGNWTIKAVPNSIGAEKFWDRVIRNYTNDTCEILHTGKYNRAVFNFTNK